MNKAKCNAEDYINFIVASPGNYSCLEAGRVQAAAGLSNAKTLVVKSAPPTPGVINGSAVVCASSSGNYSIAAVTGATTYTWTAPAGVSISSSDGPMRKNTATSAATDIDQSTLAV